MLVISRFRVADDQTEQFRVGLQEALEVLGSQRGFVDGSIGRNVDDPALWVLQTRWTGPGAYRRGLGAYDVKVRAWALLGQALDEPSAYEVVTPGEPLNSDEPRESP